MGNRQRTTYTGQHKYFDIDQDVTVMTPSINEVEYAEVLDVVLQPDKDEKDTIGRIRFRYLFESGKDAENVSWAYPLNSGIRVLPVVHEVVPIIEMLNRYYYLGPINHTNNINNNIAPLISDSNVEKTGKSDNYSQNSSSGIPNKKDNNSDAIKMGEYFENKNKSVSTLKHYEGDFILQGRFGNNIRFGSNSVDKTNLPQIKISLIDDEEVALKDEQLDKDNCIWLTNDGRMEFSIKSILIHGDNNPPSEYSGKQIMIFTDRLVVQTKENEMMFYSNKGIHFASNLNFSVDTDKKILTHSKDNTEINTEKKLQTYSELETEILSLKTFIGGIDEGEPLVIGGKWKEMMLKLLDILIKHKHPTGTGPSGPPIEAPELVQVKTSISNKEQLSDDNFTIKKNR